MRDLAGRTWPHARRGTRHGERGGVVARDERERERERREFRWILILSSRRRRRIFHRANVPPDKLQY